MANKGEIELAGQAWDQATAGITGATAALAPFRQRFVDAITSGAPLEEIDRDLEDQLADIDWQWPWFEEWFKTFSEWGFFPFLWPPMAPEPDEAEPYSEEELAAYRRAAIAPLIAHSAAMIFYRDRHLTKAHSFQKWRLFHRNDPAEMRVAIPKEIAIMSGDMTSLPPFFPGDRTSLQAERPLGPAAGAPPQE